MDHHLIERYMQVDTVVVVFKLEKYISELGEMEESLTHSTDKWTQLMSIIFVNIYIYIFIYIYVCVCIGRTWGPSQ